MKKLLVYSWLLLLFAAAGALFWYNDIVYRLPTPIPSAYHPVALGSAVELKGPLATHHTKPIFLHFFNPDCACSRFNIPQFRALAKQYGSQVDFAVVVITNGHVSEHEIQAKIGVDIPVMFDTSLPAACGVYSTPQAVLLDTAHRLYYRGNYNRGRYCADEKTNFAKIALTGILNGYNRPFSPIALRAYGCELVSCKKN